MSDETGNQDGGQSRPLPLSESPGPIDDAQPQRTVDFIERARQDAKSPSNALIRRPPPARPIRPPPPPPPPPPPRPLSSSPPDLNRRRSTYRWTSARDCFREASPSRAKSPNPVDDADYAYQTVFNDQNSANTTVHLDLPVTQDLDDQLEEFARLSRLGHFEEARGFFRSTLVAHVDDPYIFIHLAEMYLESGDYKSVLSLDPNLVFERDQPHPSEPITLPHWNFMLIHSLALLRTDPSHFAINWQANPALRALLDLKFDPAMGSTEVRIITLTLRVAAEHRYSFPFEFRCLLDEWVDWQALGRNLLATQRDWEFRDVVCSGAATFGYEEFAKKMSHQGGMNHTIPWQEFIHDESASLAHLDMLSTLLRTADPETDGFWMARDRTDAKALADIVMTHHAPMSLRSRSFALWLLAETALTGRDKSPKGQGEYLRSVGLMGLCLGYSRRDEIHEIHEIPFREWFDVAPTANEPINAALSLAKETGDLGTQVHCLRLLIQRSAEPSILLRDLADIEAKRGDRVGQHQTYLSSFHGCHQLESQIELLENLTSLENDNRYVMSAKAERDHKLVKEALAHNLGKGPSSSDPRTARPRGSSIPPARPYSPTRWLATNEHGSRHEEKPTPMMRPRYGSGISAPRGQSETRSRYHRTPKPATPERTKEAGPELPRGSRAPSIWQRGSCWSCTPRRRLQSVRAMRNRKMTSSSTISQGKTGSSRCSRMQQRKKMREGCGQSHARQARLREPPLQSKMEGYRKGDGKRCGEGLRL
ncbi:hypothetical protein RB595_002339 [Gaeumannomyces hyphopodioides]